jgi:hypothetical protein
VSVILAATLHDPDERLYSQTIGVLPALTAIFAGVAIDASSAVSPATLALLRASGAHVDQRPAVHPASLTTLGGPRRACLELALRCDDAPCIMYCDFDRALHWAERYPEELAQVVARLPGHDCTVLGRTPRAFASHPRMQRETEAIINHVFGLVSGQPWSDVTAAARGLSRRAAWAILDGCPEQSLGTDVAWPLFLQRAGDFSLGYIAAEGLEFETADRFDDEITAAGGLDSWLAQLDADPRAWAFRLELAQIEVTAALRYV